MISKQLNCLYKCPKNNRKYVFYSKFFTENEDYFLIKKRKLKLLFYCNNICFLFLDSKRKNGVKKEAYGIDSLDREK